MANTLIIGRRVGFVLPESASFSWRGMWISYVLMDSMQAVLEHSPKSRFRKLVETSRGATAM
jgi:hypothetical protein